MLRRFLRDQSGAYAVVSVVAMLPIMGGLALAIDFAEMSRERQITLNALDAAGIATANRISDGATDEQALAYAQDFFKANLGSVSHDKAKLRVVLPTTTAGGGLLKMYADLKYDPYFLPVFRKMLNGGGASTVQLDFNAKSEIRLKNTIEVSLVLDNSGSMTELGGGSGQVRFDLLKAAAKKLVDDIAKEAAIMRQVPKPVQFSVVPFAASVNIGSAHAGDSYMDTTGLSPIHHENFDWTTLNKTSYPTRYAEKVGQVWLARGAGWGADQQDKPLTRFSIYNKMQRVTTVNTCKTYKNGVCTVWNGGAQYIYGSAASWDGCVEARPYPYNINDAAASSATPETLFVPMFAPDETDRTDSNGRPANNNWRTDVSTGTDAVRQRFMPKYFDPGTTVTAAYASGTRPNASCTTKPITPLTDVSNAAGLTTVKGAIDAMVASGATNVPEGMAWGWRTLSSGEPFTGGRSEASHGNDKVVIVLTDGANTYYTPDSVRAQDYSGANWMNGGNDLAGAKAIYSSYGYLKPYSNAYTDGRVFLGTSVSKSTFTNANYTVAMNQHFAGLCANAKAGKVIVMTVALDLDKNNTAEKAQIDALTACASESRFVKGKKLFWNATGATLSKDFESIADELSNLRIVG